MHKGKEIADIALTLWYLPLDKIEEVKKLVLGLKEKHGFTEPTDDSDEWTEEDWRDFTASSISRMETEDPWPEEEAENAQAG